MQTALYSSVLADALSDLVLIFLAAPVAAIALRIGPAPNTVWSCSSLWSLFP